MPLHILLMDGIIKLALQLNEILLQLGQGGLDCHVGVPVISLHLYFQHILQRVRQTVPRKFHLVILQQEYAQQIPQRVVF